MEIQLSGDLQTVTITQSEPIALDTNGVEELVKLLGELRSRMKPEIALEYPLGQKCNVVLDPRWTTEPDVMMGNTLIHLRDPKLGWLHYMVPKEEARKLAGYLQAQADAPPPGQSSGRAN